MTTDWVRRAFCRGANPEIFEDPRNQETALAYCQRCVVRPQCLAHALTLLPHPEGVWGGTTDEKRARLRRGGRRVTCPSCSVSDVYADDHSQVCVSCGLAWRITSSVSTYQS